MPRFYFTKYGINFYDSSTLTRITTETSRCEPFFQCEISLPVCDEELQADEGVDFVLLKAETVRGAVPGPE